MASVRALHTLPVCVPYGMPATLQNAYGPWTGAGSVFPIGFTLEEIMLLYWRIKRIKLITTNPAVFDESAVFDPFQNTNTTFNETTLVCRPTPFNTQWNASDSIYTDAPIDRLQSWAATLFMNWNTIFRLRVDERDIYYFYFVVDFSTTDSSTDFTDPNNPVLLYLNQSFVQSNYLLANGSNVANYSVGGTITFLGKTISLAYDTGIDGDYFDAGSIVPSEYYPYDPGDGGGPIYDTVTGVQLREFPE